MTDIAHRLSVHPGVVGVTFDIFDAGGPTFRSTDLPSAYRMVTSDARLVTLCSRYGVRPERILEFRSMCKAACPDRKATRTALQEVATDRMIGRFDLIEVLCSPQVPTLRALNAAGTTPLLIVAPGWVSVNLVVRYFVPGGTKTADQRAAVVVQRMPNGYVRKLTTYKVPVGGSADQYIPKGGYFASPRLSLRPVDSQVAIDYAVNPQSACHALMIANGNGEVRNVYCSEVIEEDHSGGDPPSRTFASWYRGVSGREPEAGFTSMARWECVVAQFDYMLAIEALFGVLLMMQERRTGVVGMSGRGFGADTPLAPIILFRTLLSTLDGLPCLKALANAVLYCYLHCLNYGYEPVSVVFGGYHTLDQFADHILSNRAETLFDDFPINREDDIYVKQTLF